MSRYFKKETVEYFVNGEDFPIFLTDGINTEAFSVLFCAMPIDESHLKVWFNDCCLASGDPEIDEPSDEYVIDINAGKEELKKQFSEAYEGYAEIVDNILEYAEDIDWEDFGFSDEEEIEEFERGMQTVTSLNNKEFVDWLTEKMEQAISIIQRNFGLEEKKA